MIRRSPSLAAVALAVAAASCRKPPAPATERASPATADASADVGISPAARAAATTYRAGLDTLAAELAALARATERPLADSAALARARAAFVAARGAYKRVEGVVEAVAPSAAMELNGPALPEVEEEEGVRESLPPKGLQVVEAMLWPAPDLSARAELRAAVGISAAVVERVRQYARAAPIPDALLFDAARQEIARVAVLGMAGFDSPVAGRAIPEAAEALRGVRTVVAPYATAAAARAPQAWGALVRTLDGAVAALDSAAADPRAFERTDRLRFVTAVANPAARALAEVRIALGVPVPAGQRLWRATAATLFEPGAFDPGAYAPALAPAPTPELAALGAQLFFDRGLSGSGDRSCATCHEPARAFTDGRRRAEPLAGAPAGRPLRNTPTLANVALQAAQFADLRATFLEDQVLDVVRNRAEMHGSLDSAAARMTRDPALAVRVATALGRPAGALPAVTERDLRAALAAYLRTLVALDTPVDRALRGDTLALSPAARRGFTVFMAKGKCGTCHFAPLFNGTVPPAYRKAESEVLGVPGSVAWRGARVSPDVGRYGTFDAPVWRHAFKTPTVREAARTAPYMHNGVYRTLEEVIEFYDRGGGAGIGIDLPHQTLPPEPLRLTRAEKRELLAFLRALRSDRPAFAARGR